MGFRVLPLIDFGNNSKTFQFVQNVQGSLMRSILVALVSIMFFSR